jgi:hypothetical protein
MMNSCSSVGNSECFVSTIFTEDITNAVPSVPSMCCYKTYPDKAHIEDSSLRLSDVEINHAINYFPSYVTCHANKEKPAIARATLFYKESIQII